MEIYAWPSTHTCDNASDQILYQAGDIFLTTSVIKLVVLTEYFAQIVVGKLSPDQPV